MSIASTLICPSDKVYATIIKKTGNWAYEESFTVSANGAVSYTSPTLVNYRERTLEVCLPVTTNNVYTLTMKDSRSDSWTDGAWIEIKDINDHTVLKYIMTDKTEETVDFSLFSHQQECRMEVLQLLPEWMEHCQLRRWFLDLVHCWYEHAAVGGHRVLPQDVHRRDGNGCY